MEETINTNVKDFSKTSNTIQTIIVFLLALLVPTFLGQLIQVLFGANSFIASHSQFIIGSIVNACLVSAAINFKGWGKILGVVTMPSIATILSGYVFGSAATVYMVCMIPAIWIGNFVLIYAIKSITLKKGKSFILSALVGIVSKVAVIFLFFLVIKGIVNMPEKIASNLQMAMSVIQLATATIGSVIGFGIYKAETIKK